MLIYRKFVSFKIGNICSFIVVESGKFLIEFKVGILVFTLEMGL